MPAETMKAKLDSRNHLTLPAAVRAALEVKPGDQVLLVIEDGEVRLTTRRKVVQSLCGKYKLPDGRSLTDELLAERRAEAEAKGW